MTVRSVAPPPLPFDPVEVELREGTHLHRVYASTFGGPTDFADGSWAVRRAGAHVVPESRFSYFSDEGGAFVPVIYAAESTNAALWETILRDRAADDESPVPRLRTRGRRLARIVVARRLRIASFAGADMVRLRLPHDELVFAGPDQYSETVPWARAAWEAGFDGVRYVSRQEPSSLAYVIFAGPTDAVTVRESSTGGEIAFDDLAPGGGFEWLQMRLSRWGITAAM